MENNTPLNTKEMNKCCGFRLSLIKNDKGKIATVLTLLQATDIMARPEEYNILIPVEVVQKMTEQFKEALEILNTNNKIH